MLNSRKERKKLEQQDSGMSVYQVTRMLKAEVNKAVRQCVLDYSCAVALYTRDKLGFGHDRTRRLLDGVGTIFEDIHHGRLSIEDIKETINKEINIIID